MIHSLYEQFKHWSATGSVYMLSDPHFGDSDCKLMDPEWIDPEKQLEIINKTIMRTDTFVCLGDVGDTEYIKRIKAGKKILILGNHDKKGACKKVFDEVYDGPLFIAEKILLSHEPVYGLSWCLNIHGHDHNNMEKYKEGCNHLNIAANVCGYMPVNLGKLIKDGILSDINSIHRETINRAIEKNAGCNNVDEAIKSFIKTFEESGWKQRTPSRIPWIMENLEALWIEHPDLRFGQLIVNIALDENKLFYMEDDEFFNKMLMLTEKFKKEKREC